MQPGMDFVVPLAGGIIELKSIPAGLVLCDTGSYDFKDLDIRR